MRVPGPQSLPVDVRKAIGALAVLPGIGVNMAAMARDVRRMRQAVELLPDAIAALDESVKSLHTDMNRMVADVGELRDLPEQVELLRGDLQRLPFVRRRPGRVA